MNFKIKYTFCRIRISVAVVWVWAGISPALWAQNTPQDTTGKVKVESSVTGEYFVQGDGYVQKLSGNVRLRQDSTLVFCDTAVLDRNDAVLRGNVLIEQGASLLI